MTGLQIQTTISDTRLAHAVIQRWTTGMPWSAVQAVLVSDNWPLPLSSAHVHRWYMTGDTGGRVLPYGVTPSI